MTLKQIAKSEFYSALAAYKSALETGKNIVSASLRVHSSLGNVPKSFKRLVNKTFRETKRVST